MSFSKSKRFPYSQIPQRINSEKIRSPNDSKLSDKSKKFIKDSLESVVFKHSFEKNENRSDGIISRRGIQRREDCEVMNSKNNLKNETIKQTPLGKFLISDDVKITTNNPLKKIANGVKKTFKHNVFSKNEYNVRKEEQKQLKYLNEKHPNSTFTYETFANELKKSFQIVTSDEKGDADKDCVEDDTEETIRNIEKLVLSTNVNINKSLQESLLKIKENSNRKFKCFLAEIVAYNVITLEEVQNQCERHIGDMNIQVRNILKNSKKLATREKHLEKTNAILKEKFNVCRSSTRNLEIKYMELLEAAEKKISHQDMLIEAMKAEIDAMELNNSIDKVLRKQKKK